MVNSDFEIIKMGLDDSLSILTPNELDYILGGESVDCAQGYGSEISIDGSKKVVCNCGYASSSDPVEGEDLKKPGNTPIYACDKYIS